MQTNNHSSQTGVMRTQTNPHRVQVDWQKLNAVDMVDLADPNRKNLDLRTHLSYLTRCDVAPDPETTVCRIFSIVNLILGNMDS